jgi:hypothetical protein
VPSAALVTACAVTAAVLTGSSSQPLTVSAAPRPTATTSVSLPKATPKPTPKPVVVHHRKTTTRHYTYVPVSYQQPVYAAARPGAHTALIVGINDTDPKNPLLGARADATNMRNALLKYGFHSSDIVTLMDGQATRPRILRELQRLVARTPSDGIAVFAAASHGAGTSFRTAEGARLYATDLGRYLGRIRAPVWTALAMCYAAGFAVPGVVGRNRIATFSSAANQLTYEIGGAGSELFYAMVKQGMIDAGAPRSVETAFNFAHANLAKDYSNLPVMSDGVPGELVLGPVTWGPPVTAAPPTPPPVAVQPDTAPDPVTVDPTPAPDNGGLGGILCGLLGCHRQR